MTPGEGRERQDRVSHGLFFVFEAIGSEKFLFDGKMRLQKKLSF
jgi:hypothetical protein